MIEQHEPDSVPNPIAGQDAKPENDPDAKLKDIFRLCGDSIPDPAADREGLERRIRAILNAE